MRGNIDQAVDRYHLVTVGGFKTFTSFHLGEVLITRAEAHGILDSGH